MPGCRWPGSAEYQPPTDLCHNAIAARGFIHFPQTEARRPLVATHPPNLYAVSALLPIQLLESRQSAAYDNSAEQGPQSLYTSRGLPHQNCCGCTINRRPSLFPSPLLLVDCLRLVNPSPPPGLILIPSPGIPEKGSSWRNSHNARCLYNPHQATTDPSGFSTNHP